MRLQRDSTTEFDECKNREHIGDSNSDRLMESKSRYTGCRKQVVEILGKKTFVNINALVRVCGSFLILNGLAKETLASVCNISECPHGL